MVARRYWKLSTFPRKMWGFYETTWHPGTESREKRRGGGAGGGRNGRRRNGNGAESWDGSEPDKNRRRSKASYGQLIWENGQLAVGLASGEFCHVPGFRIVAVVLTFSSERPQTLLNCTPASIMVVNRAADADRKVAIARPPPPAALHPCINYNTTSALITRGDDIN